MGPMIQSAYMLKSRWMIDPCTRTGVTNRQYSPSIRMASLSRAKQIQPQRALAEQEHRDADADRDGQERVGDDRLRDARCASAAEGSLGAPVVTELLAQPADARLQLSLLRLWRSPRRLTVGARRTRDVIAAHASRSQGLPGAPGQGILGGLGGRDPGLQRGRLIIHPIAALGEAQQRGRMERRIRAAHHPCEGARPRSPSRPGRRAPVHAAATPPRHRCRGARRGSHRGARRTRGHCPSPRQQGLASP